MSVVRGRVLQEEVVAVWVCEWLKLLSINTYSRAQ